MLRLIGRVSLKPPTKSSNPRGQLQFNGFSVLLCDLREFDPEPGFSSPLDKEREIEKKTLLYSFQEKKKKGGGERVKK